MSTQLKLKKPAKKKTTPKLSVVNAPTLRTAALGLAALAAVLLCAPLFLSTFQLTLMSRLVCYAIVAVGIGLAWGRGGMLTLGQGVFFGIGAYIMAMHMLYSDSQIFGTTTVPEWWSIFANPAVALIAVVALPGIVAFVLGFSIFKRRIKGAYFAIVNQALAAAVVVLLVGQQDSLGGSNGLSGFRSFMGFAVYDPINRIMFYFTAVGVLLALVAISYWLMRSRYGELLVATRDAEERVRFLGYDPALIKTAAYVIAAMIAGIAGALFVPIVGIISPAEIGVVPSIVFVIAVAAGGRASLFGPVVGALVLGWVESTLAQTFPSMWSYFQGAILVLVIVLLPGGIASIKLSALKNKARKARKATS
ncbi:urea ABC transporter permease subunit UrtC [Corynebacterium glutamicum]|uniref:urea ABC transporter permease subunit UrtC n=1 Tax=Corynebacterium glutamicum TaxID=1718 RepID=UPI00058A58EA|nr:urea ABC transporter permease subunit UrtC [Corynebacterium glutamicum]AJE66947.1 urea ABC transporter permease [Corynebacterium glutamicum]OKX89290.1 urea ABC transporter permease subunit UrtC [Corynebacterium glutamicum]TWS36195.1 urea ABC transporter permease [Corynebacterium glutamicum]